LRKKGSHFISDKKPKNGALRRYDQLEGMKREIFQEMYYTGHHEKGCVEAGGVRVHRVEGELWKLDIRKMENG
jgi:hypothetical protein